jgi:LysR family transcriptional regulator, glycine cleavage system transcriptional activator
MPARRYNLPNLAFLQGFEAAARTLSFTKAAEELFVTQSAVSRQIKALEDNLGLRLFERRSRSLTLTDNGQALYRIATDVFDRLQAATDRLRAETRARQLAITTTTGFASLWLIPRLRRFTALHPDIDVRLSATTDTLNLERSLIDISIRYCRPETVPEGAVHLFGEEMIPVCSRVLLRDKTQPLKQPRDLVHHTLLHFDYAGTEAYVDWGTWLTALGVGELKPVGALHFSQYEQMIHAAGAGREWPSAVSRWSMIPSNRARLLPRSNKHWSDRARISSSNPNSPRGSRKCASLPNGWSPRLAATP